MVKKNWTEDEDLVLLRQVAADTPFKAQHGKVMEAWNALAATITGVSGFDRPKLDGKKVLNRFSTLLEKHEDDDKVSARASGVSEAYTEKRQLLDELSAMVNDHRRAEEAKSEEVKKKKEAEVAAGALAREKAMNSLGKRTGNADKGAGNAVKSPPPKKGRLDAVLVALHEDTGRELQLKERELEMRRLELDEKRLEREEARRERDEDRKERMRMAEIEREKTMAIVEALIRSKP